MHLSDADLGAALDPAGGGPTGIAARTHAATCEVCADALRAVRGVDQEVEEVLALLDHPAPVVDLRSLEQRMAHGEDARLTQQDEMPPAHQPAGRRSPGLIVERGTGGGRPEESRARLRTHTMSVAARRSAIILALSAAAAAAAAPHSPVRQFLTRIVTRPVAHTAPAAAPVTPVAPPVARAAATPRGVAITSADRVDLVFENPQTSGQLRIHPTLGTHVSVTASADGPTYTVGSASIGVDSHDVPDVVYDVDLPPPARVRTVTIRVGDRVVFTRRGTIVRTDGALQSDGSYIVGLAH
jgi:hypothetical protein